MQVQLTENARRIFDLRYSLKDADGKPTENPDKAIVRVSEAVANAGGRYDPVAAKKLAKRYRSELLTPLKFVPNSPTWTGAGTGLGQLAACFVLPIADDLGRGRDSIFETMKVAALIQQTGGGNGFDFSQLRPKGALIKKSMGKSSGPVSFLKVYDSAFSSVQQGGTRRGANMAILRIDHPDIEEFIDAKLVEGEIANFNISVAITDEFMEAMVRDEMFELEFNGERYLKDRARKLWNKLVEGAWTLGDPGVFFVDAANRQNPCPSHYTLAATNPCGEQALPPYSNCCLGAIAVNRFVRWDGGKAVFDWEDFEKTIHLSVRFLDDVVDANKYLDDVPELREAAMNERRIGLGIMGLADLLFDMDLPYDEPEGLAFVDQLMEFLRFHAMLASIDRAAERGPFEWFGDSVYNLDQWAVGSGGDHVGSWKPPSSVLSQVTGSDAWHDSDFGRPAVDWDRVVQGLCTYGIRNACQTTVAPTGTTSNFAGLEGSGIEPAFALSYVRKVMQEEENIDLHYLSNAFAATLPDGEFSNDDVARIVASTGGSCQGLGNIPDDIQRVFKVAGDIAPRDHVYMQAVCQAWIDNAISKTINMPYDSTVDDVAEIYELAWRLGCKGITVYRQGSRQLEVLSTKRDPEVELSLTMGQTIQEDRWPVLHPIPMPDYVSSTWHPRHEIGEDWRAGRGLPGRVFEVPTPFGNMQVTVTELRSHPGRPFDVRLQIGKAGNDKHADVEAIGRMASVALRTGVDVKVVVDQLLGIGGKTSAGYGPNRIKSVADGLGKLLSNLYLTPLENIARQPSVLVDPEEEEELDWNPYSVCPDCKQATVVNDAGCSHCEVRLGGCGIYTACD